LPALLRPADNRPAGLKTEAAKYSAAGLRGWAAIEKAEAQFGKLD
jgi:hypothetical protein